MMHELIHVSRWDNFLAALQMTTCCLFWFHPLVWMIDRRLLAERESVCDEIVVRHIGKPRSYAIALSKVAKFGLNQRLEGVSWATEINLKRRIESMLEMKNKSKTSLLCRTVTSSTVFVLTIIILSMTVFTRDKTPSIKSNSITKETSRVYIGDNANSFNSSQTGNNVTKPKIIYKEKAEYTEEAKNNNIEGKVLLGVVFGADGKIGNIEVIGGLPHGLTEEAIAAARNLKFEPAT